MRGEPVVEEDLRAALLALTPRERVKIKFDPLRYLRMAHDARQGAETDLSPGAVRYLTLLTRYMNEHGADGVRDLAARWRGESEAG